MSSTTKQPQAIRGSGSMRCKAGGRYLRTLLGAAAAMASVLVGSAGAQATGYQQTNIVSDGTVKAAHTDATLINPWGVTIGQQTPFWVNSAGAGVSEVYNPDGTKQFAVTVPPKAGGTTGQPTGIVFNGSSSSFVLPHNTAATFVFATLDGTISGWNASTPNAILVVDNSPAHAAYTGLALGQRGAEPLLLAANIGQSRIDVFDSLFAATTLAGNFTDPNLPAGYAPYGIRTIGNRVYVTYVQLPPTPGPPVRGTGLGYVDSYDLSGNFVARVASAGTLNAPWGVVLAPASFGSLGGDLLIGNFGDGTISAYDPVTFAVKGQMQDATGAVIANSGLWDLVFGQQGVGDPNTLYFAAGINDEKGGLFGSISPAPAAPAAADFTVSSSASALSVVAGQATSATINLASTNSFNGAVTLTCSGEPAAVTCAFAANPVTLNGATASTTMTLSTAPRMGPGPYGSLIFKPLHPSLNDAPLLAAALFPLGIGTLFFRRRLYSKSILFPLTLVLLSGAFIATVGCGYTKPAAPQPSVFTVMVTGTSGALSHTTQVMLTVN